MVQDFVSRMALMIFLASVADLIFAVGTPLSAGGIVVWAKRKVWIFAGFYHFI